MILSMSDKGQVTMALAGSLPEICSDLMCLLLAMNDKLEEKEGKMALLAGIQAAVKLIANDVEEEDKNGE